MLIKMWMHFGVAGVQLTSPRAGTFAVFVCREVLESGRWGLGLMF